MRSIFVVLTDGIAVFGSPYGVAGGDIVLQDVMCNGSESSLDACPSDNLGTVDEECSDSGRAAGVICMRSKQHFGHIP